MNVEARLAEILSALESVGLTSLVMGGHAVRYYGLDRNTNDFDLHLAPECWDDLALRLSQASLFAAGPVVEGLSWRPNAFRRFQIGTLASGREEWLEFWRENHLLPPFAELFARHEQGPYGGRQVAFLSLEDLIRSKETEREKDWQDIFFLEEFLDARRLLDVDAGKASLVSVVAQVRSRRGFERLLQRGLLNGRDMVRAALEQATSAVSQAFLLPCVPATTELFATSVPIEPSVMKRLRAEPPASGMHLLLVEAVRRRYKLAAQAADSANKEAIRAAQATLLPKPETQP